VQANATVALTIADSDEAERGECDIHSLRLEVITRSQAVARIADRTAKNCRGHVT